MKVFINPGHALGGMPNPGAVNPITGDRECDFAAQAGRLLANYLTTAGIEVGSLRTLFGKRAFLVMESHHGLK